MKQFLQAPFPWFGGKSRVAHLVWERFGDVPNYVEPFAGSLAVLLGRPQWGGDRSELVNDADCYLSNFWRALKENPRGVLEAADWPVNEADLHARHSWLCAQEEFRRRMLTDPKYCDVRIAGWWLWGICAWLGGGWCRTPYQRRPSLGHRGILKLSIRDAWRENVEQWMLRLSERLRWVKVCCGDWRRVLTPLATIGAGVTGVFLDPPYSAEADRDRGIYGAEDLRVAHDARQWAIDHGQDLRLKIALCGYEGEHDMPDDWECVAWTAHGGMAYRGNGRGKENKHRERIWFSPSCSSTKLF
jgi:site-specific DNA-adenine methylase